MACQTTAAAPATWGVAMLVPDIVQSMLSGSPKPVPEWQAAVMFEPGATRSGLRQRLSEASSPGLGPRLE